MYKGVKVVISIVVIVLVLAFCLGVFSQCTKNDILDLEKVELPLSFNNIYDGVWISHLSGNRAVATFEDKDLFNLDLNNIRNVTSDDNVLVSIDYEYCAYEMSDIIKRTVVGSVGYYEDIHPAFGKQGYTISVKFPKENVYILDELRGCFRICLYFDADRKSINTSGYNYKSSVYIESVSKYSSDEPWFLSMLIDSLTITSITVL